MATVHFGRLVGAAGYSRTVAVKRLHPELAATPELTSALIDEARIASRIQHPNVVTSFDVVADAGELLLVMDYIPGESLARVVKAASGRGERIPVPVATSILAGVLHGLHAAHEAKSERGEPLGVVHRDVSPQNILVGADGLARVIDFGIAKARGRLTTTGAGQLKGKLAYMAPEQLSGGEVTRRADVFAASIVLWEALTGVRLFSGADEGEIIGRVLASEIARPGSIAPEVPAALDAIVMRGLARRQDERFATALEMAIALEEQIGVATARKTSEWLERVVGDVFAARADVVRAIESSVSDPGVEPSADAAALVDRDAETEVSAALVDAHPRDAAARMPRAERRSLTVLGVAIAGALIACGLIALAIARRSPDAPAAHPAASAFEAPSPSLATPPPAEAARATPQPSPVASTAAPRLRGPAPRPGGSASARAATDNNCAPIPDANGDWHPNPRCKP